MSKGSKSTVCQACGYRDGSHSPVCRDVMRTARKKLQAECDHSKYSATQTTGIPLGPPCCGNCNIELPEDPLAKEARLRDD